MDLHDAPSRRRSPHPGEGSHTSVHGDAQFLTPGESVHGVARCELPPIVRLSDAHVSAIVNAIEPRTAIHVPCPPECGHDVRPTDKALANFAKLRGRCHGKASAALGCVTLPRPVFPATTYMLTRRCTQRKFLLRPDPEMVNAFIYCLAVSSQRFEIDVIDFIQITNHMHESIYDRHGNAPQFYACFHGLLAKCVNAFRGRWENVFSSAQPSVVTLTTTEDLLDRLVYIATNAVRHHLVARVDDWPGAHGYRALLDDTPLHATRPKFFFSEHGRMPAKVALRVGIPPKLGDRDAILSELKVRVEEYEREKAAERARTGQEVLGRDAVLRQRWDASPTSREPRRKLQRTIAAVCKWARIEKLQRRAAFRIGYRKARLAMLRGRPILFPFGTYWLRRFAGVEVEAPQFLG